MIEKSDHAQNPPKIELNEREIIKNRCDFKNFSIFSANPHCVIV